MDSDLASLPDDLLDVRQDLSQYSYDPADMLDFGDDQPVQDSQQFVSSQQSSQASYKLGDSLPYGDAGFDADEDADMFDFSDPLTLAVNESVGDVDQCSEVTKVPTDAVSTDRDQVCLVEAKDDPDVTVLPVFDFFGNDTAIDVKTEPLEVSSPSVVSYSPSVASLSPDSTSRHFALPREASHGRSFISDNDLLTLSTRELNRRIRQLPADEQRKLKNRRRTLKNRGYAQTCRTRRVGQRNELETENERLLAELDQLTTKCQLQYAECERLRKERVEVDSGLIPGEVEELKANNKILVAECERLRKELKLTTDERNFYKGRLDLLMNFFTTNGIVVTEESQ